MTAWLMLPLLLLAPPAPHPWFPRPPLPDELIIVPFQGDAQRGLLLESLAGVAARAALDAGHGPLVWEYHDHSDYRALLTAFAAAHPLQRMPLDLEAATAELAQRGIVRGYLLCRYEDSKRPWHELGPHDESVNVATSLAGLMRGVVVTEALEPIAQAAGLRRLADCRPMTEAGCLAAHAAEFSRLGVGTGEPRARNARSLMIAQRLFVCSGVGEAYRAALVRCAPDSPVIGWGLGPEDGQTLPSSRHGLFQTATNWCHNLTVLASEQPGRDVDWAALRVPPPPATAPPERGRHYVCLTLTDGDNIQWMMGNFVAGSEGHNYYGHPRRGAIPFTWGVPASGLLALSPRTLAGIFTTATPNDDFVLYNGGGYFYPDVYGADRPDDRCLRLQAQRLRAVVERTGTRVLAFNFQKWNSAEALRACAVFAREIPSLRGILAFQYYPYSGGAGAVEWVDGAAGDHCPVISCRYTVWAGTGRPADTSPSRVAAQLNRLPRVGDKATADNFSFVLVHAWSRFRQPRAGVVEDTEDDVPQDADAGSSRGYDPARWTAERLDPQVVPVGAARFVELIRATL